MQKKETNKRSISVLISEPTLSLLLPLMIAVGKFLATSRTASRICKYQSLITIPHITSNYIEIGEIEKKENINYKVYLVRHKSAIRVIYNG